MTDSAIDIDVAHAVRRYRAGDSTAASDLHQAGWPRARLAASRVGGPELGREAADEAFVRSLERIDELHDERKYVGWLVTISRNWAVDQMRRRSRTVCVAALTEFEDDQARRTTEAGPLLTELARDMTERLAAWRERDRALLVSRHVLDVPVAALASEHGMTVGSMEVHLSRLRSRARRLLADLRLYPGLMALRLRRVAYDAENWFRAAVPLVGAVALPLAALIGGVGLAGSPPLMAAADTGAARGTTVGGAEGGSVSDQLDVLAGSGPVSAAPDTSPASDGPMFDTLVQTPVGSIAQRTPPSYWAEVRVPAPWAEDDFVVGVGGFVGERVEGTPVEEGPHVDVGDVLDPPHDGH